MNRTLRSVGGSLLTILALLAAAPAAADKPPPLWGYGVKPCDELLTAAQGADAGEARGDAEYRRYQDWLTGFVSGLNLATGRDVLRGAGVEDAMGRIRAHCGGNPRDDFFTATMDLVRMLSGLR